MNSYYNFCAFMHNFTPIDVGVFLWKCVKSLTFCIWQDYATIFYHVFVQLSYNFFFVEFQHMTSTPDDNSLLSNQDVNQFFGISNETHSYKIIKHMTYHE